ncbi:hypothetical protein [Paenibacillus larvae]|nr:hypothetical protein [Paenibacillus larvae]
MNMKKISLENRKEYINSLNSEIEEQQKASRNFLSVRNFRLV